MYVSKELGISTFQVSGPSSKQASKTANAYKSCWLVRKDSVGRRPTTNSRPPRATHSLIP
eukprot:15459545-Alexandrium_andersonii.AAC.1